MDFAVRRDMYNIPSGLNPFERADDLSSPLLIRAEEPHPKAIELFLKLVA